MSFLVLLVVLMSWKICFTEAQTVTGGLYVFGDSLVDIGNNNYIKGCLAKVNYPHYGVDFLNQQPTGRASNGKITSDFLAEKMGLPTSPPFESFANDLNNTSIPVTGVNFASGGSGISNYSNPKVGRVTQLSEQVEQYSKVYKRLVQQLGSVGAQQHFAKSVFAFSVGANDITSPNRGNTSKPQYVALMISGLKGQLMRLYDYGVRKFVFVGLLKFGCVPAKRVESPIEDCDEELNDLALQFNKGLKSMLQELQSKFTSFMYSYFETYNVMQEMISNPATHELKEVKAACCGQGKLLAETPCKPKASYCSNRSDHFFYDRKHPSEVIARIFVDMIYDGPSKYTFPINMKNLIAS